MTVIDGRDGESETKLGTGNTTVVQRPSATGPRSLATEEETFVSHAQIWQKCHHLDGKSHQFMWMEVSSVSPFRTLGHQQSHLPNSPRPLSVHSESSPSLSEREILSVKFGQIVLCPGKPATVGLLLSLWLLFFWQHLSLPLSVFVIQKNPAETSTKKNAGKGERIPWSRIAWKKPKVEKEV